jgi:hypothetical protein
MHGVSGGKPATPNTAVSRGRIRVDPPSSHYGFLTPVDGKEPAISALPPSITQVDDSRGPRAPALKRVSSQPSLGTS